MSNTSDFLLLLLLKWLRNDNKYHIKKGNTLSSDGGKGFRSTDDQTPSE